ncbi:MAG: N-acyl homoserine lactonase family protein [Gemmatimonadota bacterium]|nr:N-acyl homoserine lactonase family protein [Gemmatimonadota bacterium]
MNEGHTLATPRRRRGRQRGTPCLLAILSVAIPTPAIPLAAQDYEISAIRYGEISGFPLKGLLPDAPEGEAIDIALVFWLLENDERKVLFDTGFFRDAWLERFDVSDFLRPDSALAQTGITPDEVTDVVVSHAHWDHMGGIELFPTATLWIQADEYAYYTGPAWQEGGRSGGIDPDDVLHLVRRNLLGEVRLIEGDGVEFLPGLVAHTGARHTRSSQFLEVRGDPTWVLASDNAYLYRGLRERRASATFLPSDREGNLRALDRMLALAGDTLRVVPGHDVLQFERFPASGPRVVRLTGGRER